MVNMFNKIVRVMIMSDMSNHNRDDVNDMKVNKKLQYMTNYKLLQMLLLYVAIDKILCSLPPLQSNLKRCFNEAGITSLVLAKNIPSGSSGSISIP